MRGSIGVAAQAATVDGLLTGRANLELIGRLYRMSARDARLRADELLDALRHRRRRRPADEGVLGRHAAAARPGREPDGRSAGDLPRRAHDGPRPGARRELWDVLRELVAERHHVVLTTQYLDEADALADDIVVLDHGRVDRPRHARPS